MPTKTLLITICWLNALSFLAYVTPRSLPFMCRFPQTSLVLVTPVTSSLTGTSIWDHLLDLSYVKRHPSVLLWNMGKKNSLLLPLPTLWSFFPFPFSTSPWNTFLFNHVGLSVDFGRASPLLLFQLFLMGSIRLIQAPTVVLSKSSVTCTHHPLLISLTVAHPFARSFNFKARYYYGKCSFCLFLLWWDIEFECIIIIIQ